MYTNENRFLSDIQYAFLLGRQSDHALGGVSCHIYLETEGAGIDTARLMDAWNSLPYRHKGLCARVGENGEVTYTEPEEVPCTVSLYQLEDLDDDIQREKLSQLRNERSARLTDLASGELMGLAVCTLSSGRSRLMFDFDCTAFDVTSVQIILRDLAYLYAEKELPKVKNQIHFPECYHTSQEKNTARSYWSEKIKSMGSYALTGVQNAAFSVSKAHHTAHSMYLEEGLYEGIKTYSAKYGYTLDSVLLALFARAVSAVTGDEHFVLNIPAMNREEYDNDIKNAVTDTTEILIFDTDMRGTLSLGEDIKKLRVDMAEDRKHSAFSGLKVQRMRKDRQPAVTFSVHTELELLDSVFCEQLGELVYFVSQTPMVAMDSIFFIVNGRLYISLVTPDGFYRESIEEKLLESFVREAEYLKEDMKEIEYMHTPESIKADVIQLYADTLGIDKVDTSKTFNEQGGDSLKASQLQFELMKKYKVKLSFKELFMNGSAEMLSELLYSKIINNGENKNG